MLLDEILALRHAMEQQGMEVTYREVSRLIWDCQEEMFRRKQIPNGGHSAFAEFERKSGPEFEIAWNMIKEDFTDIWTQTFPLPGGYV